MSNTPNQFAEETPSAHAWTPREAAEKLRVEPSQGLDGAEAARRLEVHGPNKLREKPPRARLLLFLDQFKSLLIWILIGAAVLAGAIGDVKDAVVILIVTMINAVLGYYQESRAEESLKALKKMLALHASVRRGGVTVEVEAESLVPGEVVELDAGTRIPADGRLLESASLEVDESALTGESHPVAKDHKPGHHADTPLAERTNMVYMNTMVTRGRGVMLVSATGMKTEMGKLAEALFEAEEPPTPLQVQLDHLGKRLALIALVFIGVILTLSLFQGKPLMEALLESIALAVAAIPEGLPAVVTVTLALGMQRMAAKRAIVKRLSAVETLGSTTVICSDKTGTLTMNQMTARSFVYMGRLFKVGGEGYGVQGRVEAEDGGAVPELTALLEPMVGCNDSRLDNGSIIGDPMEAALLVLGAKGGVIQRELAQTAPRVAEVPFDSDHKFMATFHRQGDSVRLWVKGAPEPLLDRSSQLMEAKGPVALTAQAKAKLLEENSLLASRQMRVLAVASKTIPVKEFERETDLWAHLQGLTLMGLVGMVDPPRPEARDAIALCHKAGIAIKMITGDQKATAQAIAQELGLHGQVLTGAEIDQMSAEELSRQIDQISVFARVTAAHKYKIVEALQADGHVVSMTGDGVNDAPALKRAHIGVAMGQSGTEVAKEAATMVLTDDNFATIVRAIEEGRTIYDNIIKFIRFQLSTNIGALLSVLTASLLNWPSPFNTIQILWINIIMDGPPAMAMGVEPARREMMLEKPRAQSQQILTYRRLMMLLSYGVLMVVGTLGVMQWGLLNGTREWAMTLGFHTFVMFQVFNAFNARVERGSAFNHNFFQNRTLWMALAGVVILQALVVSLPSAELIFGTVTLSAMDWLLCLAIASSILVYGELFRLLTRGMVKN